MRRSLATTSVSTFARAILAAMAVALIAASCSGGDESSTGTPLEGAEAGEREAAAGGDAIPISGPASAPADPPTEFANPPNPETITCDSPELNDGITGLPPRIDEWAIVGSDQVTLVHDGGPHPGGWRYVALPEQMDFRPGVATARTVERDELAELEVPASADRAVNGRLFTMDAVVESLGSLDRGDIDTFLIPLDQSDIYGGWWTTVVFAIQSNGSVAVAGHCPGPIERAVGNALAAARDNGMQGDAVDILTRLSAHEIAGLAAGDY